MQNWVDQEMRGSNMPDKRLNTRLARILTSLNKDSEESIPAACQSWSETKGVYRFCDNPKVGKDEILSGHKVATIERVSQQQMVLLAQDTTQISFVSEESVGLGTLKNSYRNNYHLHPTVAFTPSRTNLGILGATFWQRLEKKDKREQRKKPIEEKESYRWIEGYEHACELQKQCPDTLILNVADRESDIYELFLTAQNKPEDERAELLVRAKCNRRTQKDDGEYSYLWEEMQSRPVDGRIGIKTPRTSDKASRSATLDVRFKEVEFCGYETRNATPIFMYAVYAYEKHPPKGEESIEWMLLISMPVETYKVAEAVIAWYCARWEIEIFFRVLKQGCQVEKLRLETAQRLLNCISVYLIIAWRIHTITMLSREYPDSSCEVVFSEKEWKTVYLMQQKKKPPKKPPSLKAITRMLAQLGGFLGRKGDGEPGVQNTWRGYHVLQNYIEAIDIAAVAVWTRA